MKKILFFLILTLASCQTQNIDFDTDNEIETEIDDSNPETLITHDANELGVLERSTAIKITSASASNIVGVNSECDRFKGQAKLKVGTGPDGTEFTLRGVNFGATQGLKIAEVEIPSVTSTPVPVSIISWSNTEIKLKIPKVGEATKNITIKIRLIDSVRTTTASFRSVGWFENENIWYGHNRWDLMQNETFKTLYPTLQSAKVAIGTSWIPAMNDIVIENSNGLIGVITNTKVIASGLNKGKIQATVRMRNTTCTGTTTTANYLFHIGQFEIMKAKRGFPSSFSHYLN